MPMSEHEVNRATISYFSEEDGKPTLWDTPGPGRKPVAVLFGDHEVEITTDEEALEFAGSFAE